MKTTKNERLETHVVNDILKPLMKEQGHRSLSLAIQHLASENNKLTRIISWLPHEIRPELGSWINGKWWSNEDLAERRNQ